MKKRLAVIGVGSAGILSLCHFNTYLHNDWEVVSIHNPTVPILGIGESSNAGFIESLEHAFGFQLLDDLVPLNATRKYGTMWKKWRKDEFLSPVFGGNCAIQFDTNRLKDYVLPKLKERWPTKFSVIEGSVDLLENTDKNVRVVVDGNEYFFNYVIDCRGFPTDYTDYNVFPEMPINRALVHNIETPADWGYTGHVATKHGWMFEIPLTTRQSYGYLFNDKITSLEDAKNDFSKTINVSVDQLQNIEYKFQSYYTTKLLDGRILKNGNRAGFFEPISATSIFMYDQTNRLFFNYLCNNISDAETLNLEYCKVADAVRELICWFYHGGSTHDSEFWDYAKAVTGKVVNDSKIIKNISNSFESCLDKDVPVFANTWFFTASQLYYLDKKFGYGHFSK
jgi:hypothetical protein